MIPDPRERPTLRVSEVASLLGLGLGSAYEAVRRGEIPSLRLGRRILVPTAPLLRSLGIEGEVAVTIRTGDDDPARADLPNPRSPS